jgi:hypothetical protein
MRSFTILMACLFSCLLQSAVAQKDKTFEFTLTKMTDGFRLESCIPADYYQERFMVPLDVRPRHPRYVMPDSILAVHNSSWANNCLIIDKLEPNRQEIIDMLAQITILDRTQIKLIFKQ